MPGAKADTGFLMGFIAGAVIGLAAGILYAPRSGEETRYLIKEKAEEAKEIATETVERMKEAAVEVKKIAEVFSDIA